ncbi:MAG: PAS domain-containing protein, partial [Pseudomonadota bacterium]
MDLQSVIANIGAFTQEAILIANADPADGATLRAAWVNPAFTALTGYTLNSLENETLAVLACDETDPVEHAHVIDRLSNWMHVESELKVGTREGHIFWCQLSCQPLADDGGNFRFW